MLAFVAFFPVLFAVTLATPRRDRARAGVLRARRGVDRHRHRPRGAAARPAARRRHRRRASSSGPSSATPAPTSAGARSARRPLAPRVSPNKTSRAWASGSSSASSACGSPGPTRTGWAARTRCCSASASSLAGAGRRPLRELHQARRGHQGHRPAVRRPRRARWTGSTRCCSRSSSATACGWLLSRRPRRPDRGVSAAATLYRAVPRRLLVLGSTGSIGTQALDVVERSEDLELVGLSAERSWEALVAQAERTAWTASPWPMRTPRRAPPRRGPTARCSPAPRGSCRLVIESGADLVLNALVGSAGLGPTVATLGEGIDLALANKESLVVGGELVTQLAEATGRADPARRLRARRAAPADGRRAGRAPSSGYDHRVRRPVPRPLARELADVTVEEALEHPTWAMGGKITIDSATLMNKGLEVIEAHHLFGVAATTASTSSCTRSRSSTRLVELSTARRSRTSACPTCACAIAYALHHPERVDVPDAAARPRRAGRAGVRAGRRRGVPVPAAGPRGRAGGRHRAVRAQRRQRGRRARVPDRPPGVHGHRRGHRAHARGAAGASRSTRSSRSSRPTARRARSPASWSRRRRPDDCACLAFAGFAALDHPARARATSPPPRRSACASSASRCSSRR